MDTIMTNKIPISESEFNQKVYENSRQYINSFLEDIGNLIDSVKKLSQEKEQIYLLGVDSYWDTNQKIIIPNFDNYPIHNITDSSDIPEDYFLNKGISGELNYEFPMLTQIRKLRGFLQNYWGQEFYIACICDDNRYGNYYDLIVAYDALLNKTSLLTLTERPVKVAPVINLKYSTIPEFIVKYLIPYGMCPDGLSSEDVNCLSDLTIFYKRNSECIYIDEQGKFIFNGGAFLIDKFIPESNEKWITSLHWELVKVLKEYYMKHNIEGELMDIKNELLYCEKERADIEPYEERLLTDPNRGHWDLWTNQDDSKYTVEVVDKMVARNPLCDVNENGVIAIDFGTKSTIVVYQSDIEHSLPMGIGDGKLSKEPTPKRYENPTVMHFVDLDGFLEAYSSRKGRPKTKWNDLTISHTAMDQFLNSKSDEYYEYLHQIKQWAGQREKQFRIQSNTGKTYVLPSFLDLTEEDWNPIELYAYYIGLYINNMRKGHGIFLDYYLSFPVTYETKIREKIVHSFEKGLKKSLPESILENDELMKKFHVNGEISEPAAYAVCALQEYGFEPEENEEIFYGIFDFGGGTTDFDFGLWKQSKKRRYDYTIENFGAGGDEYLGGENLLELMAFEVFKENQAMMREKRYTFTLAPKCTEFLGSDSLLADSQEAEKNMHNLMEKLRPYWEDNNYVAEPEIDDSIQVEKLIAEINKVSATHKCGSMIEDNLKEIITNKKNLNEDDAVVLSHLTELIDLYGLEIKKQDSDKIKFVLTLFDKEGQDHPSETLYFSKKKLDKIIEERIKEGVDNFFSALLLSYQNDKVKKPTTVNILLAGNSCKSPIVKKVFGEKIVEQQKEIKEKYHVKDKVENLFELFPPLGTEEAYEKMKARGLTPSVNDFEKPTGKTGVAFGLIQCRAGGTIERITNVGIEAEIPFQYFIGWRSKKKFVLFKDDSKITKYQGKPDYNVWYKFIEADDSVFDLYYTTLPECISGQLIVDGNAAVKRLRCEIDFIDENAYVYIRAIDPHTLEYVVAENDDVDNSQLGAVIRKEL